MPLKNEKLLILFVISFFSLCAQAQNPAKPLFPFDSREQVDKWVTRKSDPPTIFQLNTDRKYIKQGTGSVLFKAPSLNKSGVRWPAAIFHKPSKLDMRGFDKITFYVFNPLKQKQSLNLQFIISGGAKKNVKQIALAPGPGWTKISRELPNLVAECPIETIHFYQANPAFDTALYIDDVCLEVDPELFAKKVAKLISKIREKKDEFEDVKNAPREYAELEKQLNSLLLSIQAPGGLMRACHELVVIKDKYLDLARKYNQKKNLIIANKFEDIFKGQNWGYGWQNGATKIIRKDFPFSGTIGGRIKVSLARNEREGVQLVLRSKIQARNIKVKMSPLKNASSEEVFPSDNISVLLVGYIDLEQPPYAVDRLGWTADSLLDFLPTFDIEKDVWQPVWLDVYVPADTKPGIYKGTVEVMADKLKTLNVPLEIEVWDFELPQSNSLPTAITHCDGTALKPYRKIFAKPKEVWKQYEKFRNGGIAFEKLSSEAQKLVYLSDKTREMLIEHRIMPDSLYNKKPIPLDVLKRTVKSGAKRTNIIYIKPIRGIKKGELYPVDQTKYYLEILNDYVPKLKKAGLMDKVYVYAFDEIGESSFAAAQDILRKIKKRFPELHIITTSKDNTFGEKSGLGNLIDSWVPLSPRYVENLDKIEEVRKKGKHVWWYVCCGPNPPSANLFPDQPATAHRLLMGFMVQKYKPEGFLYYQTSKWLEEPMITKGPLTDQTGRSAYQGYNGDGMLFYPGPNGPLSSIRLKAMRDGIEDYEYCVMLEESIANVKSGKVKISSEWLEKAENIKMVPQNICVSLTQYTHDGKELMDYRNEIGEILNEYYKVSNTKK